MTSWLGGLFGPSDDQIATRQALSYQEGYDKGFDAGVASVTPEVRYEVLDVRPELSALDATLRNLGLSGTVMPPARPTLPVSWDGLLDERKVRTLMNRLTAAVTKIRTLAEEYKALGELIAAVEAGTRTIHKVTVAVRGQGNQKSKSVEVHCHVSETVALLKEEQRRKYDEIQQIQEEAHSAINEVAAAPAAPAVVEGIRRIRRAESDDS